MDKAETAKRNNLRGKRVQRRVAKDIKGKDVGILGYQDVISKHFSVEVKSREKFVGESFLKQSEKTAISPKIPIAIVHLNGSRYDNDIVLIRKKHFLKLTGE